MGPCKRRELVDKAIRETGRRDAIFRPGVLQVRVRVARCPLLLPNNPTIAQPADLLSRQPEYPLQNTIGIVPERRRD
jgi:hypothetical protein